VSSSRKDWRGPAIAASEARLCELGGLADDDSLRAVVQAKALHAFAALLDGERLPTCTPEELASLAHILAENADRIAERQMIDAARTRAA
jgi:hypothetical protein